MLLNQLEQYNYFPSSVYKIDKPEFLESVNEVSNAYLELAKINKPDLDEFEFIRMTSHYFSDLRIKDFASYVAQTSWEILQSQGHAMQDKGTFFLEMWSQECYKFASMDQHTHNNNAHINAFYFLNEPKDSSKLVFHDPRAVKVITNLPEQDINVATPASIMVNFEPKAGMLILTNNYLPHSFSKHKSDEPLKFVHMTIGVAETENTSQATVI